MGGAPALRSLLPLSLEGMPRVRMSCLSSVARNWKQHSLLYVFRKPGWLKHFTEGCVESPWHVANPLMRSGQIRGS